MTADSELRISPDFLFVGEANFNRVAGIYRRRKGGVGEWYSGVNVLVLDEPTGNHRPSFARGGNALELPGTVSPSATIHITVDKLRRRFFAEPDGTTEFSLDIDEFHDWRGQVKSSQVDRNLKFQILYFKTIRKKTAKTRNQDPKTVFQKNQRQNIENESKKRDSRLEETRSRRADDRRKWRQITKALRSFRRIRTSSGTNSQTLTEWGSLESAF